MFIMPAMRIVFVPALVALGCLATACVVDPSNEGDVALRHQEILGGTAAAAGDYPAVVAVVNRGLCTGTLIAPDLVLTAAHCLTPSLLGLSSQAEVTAQTRIIFDTDNATSPGGIVASVAETTPNPGFNPSAIGTNDIGLIRLQTPVTDRTPVPINRIHSDAPVGVSVLQVGYGATQVGGGSAGRLFALRDKKTTSCAQLEPGLSDDKLLCFSQTDGTGKCQGDSGGPSFATIGDVRRVVGVTSFGDQSCAQFGADTRVDAELSFLFEIAPELQCQSDGACNEACGKASLPVDDDCAVCSSDQDCDANSICNPSGKCVAAPFSPGGEGSECLGDKDCDSGLCGQSSDANICTSLCTSDNACLDGFECVSAGDQSSVCWPKAKATGGCSLSGGGDGGLGGALTLLLAALALVVARRRQIS